MPINEPTVELTLARMREKLAHIVPEVELRHKAELVFKINQEKTRQGAIILGHNYMEPALFHTVCDIVGDSLQLSREAAKTKADPIIFCGVRFMAETAKILNPQRTVLLPAKVAGCSLASSITAEQIVALKAQYPGAPVVTYINTYTDVKAESDIIVTSGNASKIVNALNERLIIFLPDEYMGRNIAAETGRQVLYAGDAIPSGSNPLMLIWRGRCEVHEKFTVDDIKQARRQFPEIKVLTHPECHPDVVESSDYSAGTTKMVDYVRQTPAAHFLILTECSMGDNIIAENPDKDIVRMCSIRCPHMNEITLEDTLDALLNHRQKIEIQEDLRLRAKKALDRMLEFG